MRHWRTGIGVSFGTFGELLQGALDGPDADFLVTLPIARWSTARITLQPGRSALVSEPPGKHKALRLARAMLDRYAVGHGGTLTLRANLPEGKGMASSSADLVATARALADALGVAMTARQLEAYLREIEPTDGLMYREIVAFYHRKVELCRVLGPVPPLTVVGVDEGGQVDTVDYNASRAAYTTAQRREYARLLDLIGGALAERDLAAVGRVATASALLNQERCPKRFLEPMLAIAEQVGALGVAVAHSGTMIGIVLSGADPEHEAKLAAALAACGELSTEVSVDRSLHSVATPVLTSRGSLP